MKRNILAVTTALAIGAWAPTSSAQTMEMGYNMLTGAVYNLLRTRHLPTDDIGNLTLNQLAQIKSIADSSDSDGQKNQRIESILRKAGEN